ncbi:TolC family protein [Dyadobacter sp. NIV53]|uniref:TolC family protein n=1 Tax=Dyadobacter sp. NIV53 TaxID=2861765 RepID=UPI00210456D0|nr:TolC family protein [Dyadobacter sp. NIV53]
MSKQGIFSFTILLSLYISTTIVNAQQILTIEEAVHTAQENYGILKAKSNYVNASKATVLQSKADYLPNLNFSLQQDFGTVNGQNGPLYGLGLSVASSGLPLPQQNWNSAFGSLYLTNVNWEFLHLAVRKKKSKWLNLLLPAIRVIWIRKNFSIRYG